MALIFWKNMAHKHSNSFYDRLSVTPCILNIILMSTIYTAKLSFPLSLLLRRASCRFTNYHTTNKCTNCMSFIFKSLFKTLSLLSKHVGAVKVF